MIKLKSLLKEDSVKVNENKLKDVEFNVFSKDFTIIFIPKTSKDLDIIDGAGLSDSEVQKSLVEFCEKKIRGFKFDRSISYRGAGYGIDLDMDSLVKKLV